MFDVGFIEITVILIIAIVVVGPERLPALIQKVVSTLKIVRKFVNNVKDEVEKELNIDELKNTVRQSFNDPSFTEIKDLKQKITQEVLSSADEIKQTLSRAQDEIRADQMHLLATKAPIKHLSFDEMYQEENGKNMNFVDDDDELSDDELMSLLDSEYYDTEADAFSSTFFEKENQEASNKFSLILQQKQLELNSNSSPPAKQVNEINLRLKGRSLLTMDELTEMYHHRLKELSIAVHPPQ